MKLVINEVQKLISNKTWEIIVILLLLCIYAALFYLIITGQAKPDFLSLYAAIHALAEGYNPYAALSSISQPTQIPLPNNLNPPFVLWLFSPLSRLDYKTALTVWSALSFTLGLIGANLAFKTAFSPAFMKKYQLYLYLIYLSFFATMMNAVLAQLGAMILFIIMSGYYLYIKNRDYSAGVVWGLIISMKLFPGLLFFYALAQKRYRVCITMLCTSIFMWFIPLLVYGATIYSQYLYMMSKVFWYGDNWNASLYGIIFRLFVNASNRGTSILFVHIAYISLFFIFIALYLKRIIQIEKLKIEHQSFCLTIVMMLLLSPLGWLYYFPLLTLPLALTWLSAINEKKKGTKALFMWFLCLFLLNLPMSYNSAPMMHSLIGKIGIYSFYFYGLLLLLYLSNNIKIYDFIYIKKNQGINYLTPVFFAIFSFNILTLVNNIIVQFVFY